MLFDTTALDAEQAELQSEMAIVAGMIQQCVDENAHVTQDQDEYQQIYETLVGRFETPKQRFEDVSTQLADICSRSNKMASFTDSIKKQDSLIYEFDGKLWYCLVDSVTMYCKEDVKVKFKNGATIRV